MSAQKTDDPATRPTRRNSAMHLYTVGQPVRITSGFIHPFRTEGIYNIVSTLPPSDGIPQYRIRNDGEGHERVTTQNHLEAVDTLSGGDGVTQPEPAFEQG